MFRSASLLALCGLAVFAAPALAAPVSGTRSVLVIPVAWPGSPADGLGSEQMRQQIAVTDRDWYATASGGKLALTATVSPVLTIAGGTCDQYPAIVTQALNAATAVGFDLTKFTNRMVYLPMTCDWAGKGGVNNTWSVIRRGAFDTRATVHELGHNFGLNHAHSLTCADPGGTAVALSSACTVTEYGDLFDAMGNAPFVGTFSASNQVALGWLDGRSQTITGPATVTLAPYENTSGLAALDVVAGAQHYWVEYRQALGLDAFLNDHPGGRDGVLIHTVDPTGTNLLDLRPATTTFADAALPVGARMRTPQGVTISVEGASAAGATVKVTNTAVPLDTSITGGPIDAGRTRARSARLTYTSEPATRFRCSLDAAPPSPCNAGVGQYDTLATGRHTFAVSALDAMGNLDPTPATRSWTVTDDVDGDGYPAPADCNDTNPSIGPSAVDIPNNRVDEDCNGGDAIDADHDGYPRPVDCVDTNAAIHPGAIDRPDNRLDEDCSGSLTTYASVRARVRASWSVRGSRTRLRSLSASNLAAGTTLTVRCRGRCGVRMARLTFSKPTASVRLSRAAWLSAHARLEVTITHAGMRGLTVAFTTRARRTPAQSTNCLPATRADHC
jgi:hypothetical protein